MPVNPPKDLSINSPAILLVGKTGAGKSTLGNLLLKTSEDDTPTFVVSDSFKSVTKRASSANYKIGDKTYNIVDTPGIFDTDDLNEDIMNEIAHTIQKCAYGVKAILFVFEAKRFTEEQKNVINGIVTFLGEDALQYIISVFSHCNRKQTENAKHLKGSWNDQVRAFVNSVGNRWAVSPNSELFPPDHQVHKQRLEELQQCIASIDGVYTNNLLENARKKQEEIARIAKEAEEKRQREYDEIKRREGAAVAEANYLKQKADDDERARRDRENELQNVRNSLNEQISNLNERINQLSRENNELRHQGGGRGCFWLETQVMLESGRIIQMSELQIGDRVLSNIRNGISEFSDVYLIAHVGKLDHNEKFTKISFTRPGGSKGQLKLTTTHYVFDENLSIMFAKNLQPGKTKILVSDDNNNLVSVLVDNVTNEWHDKYISFYTRAGSVIANGVLCSCYDHCPPSQILMDLVFLPVRWWTFIKPSTYRGEQLHPYVQFLETVYLSFVNAVKKGKRFIEK